MDRIVWKIYICTFVQFRQVTHHKHGHSLAATVLELIAYLCDRYQYILILVSKKVFSKSDSWKARIFCLIFCIFLLEFEGSQYLEY